MRRAGADFTDWKCLCATLLAQRRRRLIWLTRVLSLAEERTYAHRLRLINHDTPVDDRQQVAIRKKADGIVVGPL